MPVIFGKGIDHTRITKIKIEVWHLLLKAKRKPSEIKRNSQKQKAQGARRCL